MKLVIFARKFIQLEKKKLLWWSTFLKRRHDEPGCYNRDIYLHGLFPFNLIFVPAPTDISVELCSIEI